MSPPSIRLPLWPQSNHQGQQTDPARRQPADHPVVIAHQANARILTAVEKALGLPAGTVPVNIDRYGNTTAGTIPIALHEARQQGRVRDGDLVCFVGLGSGLNWGASLHRF